MQFAFSRIIASIAQKRALAPISLLLTAGVFLAGCAMTSGGADTGAEVLIATAGPRISQEGAATMTAPTAEPGAGAEPGDGQPASDGAAFDAPPTPGETAPAALSQALPGEQTAQTLTHTIKAGDTLTRIAELYDVSIKALLLANELPNPDYLEVGQVVNLPAAPVDYTPSFRILPDSRLVRSAGAFRFDVERFLAAQPGALGRIAVMTPTRLADGMPRNDMLTGSQIVERVSREYSVDARVLLAFLERFAGLVTDPAVDEEARLYPLLAPEPASGRRREGLYNQLSWLADRLNQGYYDWKYRGAAILQLAEGGRLFYHPDLNAGSVAVQYALAQLSEAEDWEIAAGEAGLQATYRRLFGDPFQDARPTVPADLRQPALTLPFPRGETWRFTGGFHGGWGNGSAWSAIDFAPPDHAEGGWCYTSKHPTTAIARGVIARLGDGVVVLDLDEDGDEGSGWTILYLHLSPHDALREGQVVEAGQHPGLRLLRRRFQHGDASAYCPALQWRMAAGRLQSLPGRARSTGFCHERLESGRAGQPALSGLSGAYPR